jgi:hypothetical protein
MRVTYSGIIDIALGGSKKSERGGDDGRVVSYAGAWFGHGECTSI